MSYPIFPLKSEFNKKDFNCGKDMLDNYIQKKAGQDLKRRLSAVFAMVDDSRVIAYYTLSSTSISRDLVPEETQKKMPPSYHDLPATLLGRLAVDQNYKGQRLGEYLLMDALKKAFDTSEKHIGSMALIVDPLDDDAEAFYAKYDFIKLDSGKMFLTMQNIAALFK
ncbi:GNAT family N-acetyltransferase [Mucilaginibacter jinjuensis]|uniref:GNAT family N-acetyltransferase n=1 Tax=Mucilaginibacter jinjuensis TaxID=1176721 RepID=A0ABY7TFD4_9SPHI|nr:GNAT family N-acetyltransferase [Mucilaginibacter jinjuensis]WCT14438.1 GNAT family N-acetyltransferase [Mucilaginibacter jinjuensis]